MISNFVIQKVVKVGASELKYRVTSFLRTEAALGNDYIISSMFCCMCGQRVDKDHPQSFWEGSNLNSMLTDLLLSCTLKPEDSPSIFFNCVCLLSGQLQCSWLQDTSILLGFLLKTLGCGCKKNYHWTILLPVCVPDFFLKKLIPTAWMNLSRSQ